MTTSRILLACVFALGLVGAGCSSASSKTSAPPSQVASSASSASPTKSLTPTAAPMSCTERVFDRMTPAERAGQLFLVGMPVVGGPGAELTSAIRAHHFGSVVFVGDTRAGVAGVLAMTRAVQALATGGVRLLVGANQEGGEIQPLAGPGFATIPSAVAQGQMPVAELRRDAATWGRELKAAGVNLDLAPVLDVVPPGTAASNAPIGALEREYGDAPGPVASHGVAFIQGLRAAGVATTAKHFPGLGRVHGNTDFTADVVDTVTTASDPYLKTYRAAIEDGVPFVMVALATYTRIDARHLAVFSSRIVTGMLRRDMGFQGVIMSDDLGAAAAVAALPPADRAIEFLEAGGDMITSQGVSMAVDMDNAVVRKAASDAAFRALVNTAVMRVLAAKQAAGLISCG